MSRIAPPLLAVCLLVLSCLPGCAEEGRRDPLTGRIRIIYIGDAILTRNPVYIYKSDPTFIGTLIPACLDDLLGQGMRMSDIYRYMRQYMPKTFEQMRDSLDVILLSDVHLLNFKPEEVVWMERCVREAGLGLIMVGGYESFGGVAGYTSWDGTAVAEALPVEFHSGGSAPSDTYRVQVLNPENELMKYLPWDKCPPFYGLNIVTVKQGADELASVVGLLKREFPLLDAWDYRQGRTVAFTPDWTPAWGESFSLWEYYLDCAANMGMYASRVPVPRDVVLVHTIRGKFFALTNQKALLTSLFAFVESFGASSAKLEGHMAKIDQTIRSAEASYIGQEYDASLSLLKEAEQAVGDLEKEAMKLKDTAMIWVYFVEWSAVTATCLVCGIVLWTVMVRRRLYREVQMTRATYR